MSHRRASPVLLTALLAAAGCHTAPDTVATREYGGPRVLASDLGAMHNVSVADAVWIGSFPTPADLDLAHRRGIETVIDLSLVEEGRGYDVAGTCAKLGLAYVRVSVECARTGGFGVETVFVPDTSVDLVLSELRRANARPVLMFCANGTRAAMLFAIWRAVEGGVPLEDALVEGRRAGMKPGAPEDFVLRQVARLSEIVAVASSPEGASVAASLPESAPARL